MLLRERQATIYLPHFQLQDSSAKALRKRSKTENQCSTALPEVLCKTRESIMAKDWRKNSH